MLIEASARSFSGEIRRLFYQRTRLCLWLGVIFFSLFSILDFIYCRPYFGLFLFYRLSLVIFFLAMLLLLRNHDIQRYTKAIMFAAMLLGTLTISLMTVKLGGFSSGYYVGILLMIAGGFSVLPLSVLQALFLGSLMYLVYACTVYLGSHPLGSEEKIYVINNSFFFLSIVLVTAAQCFDDLQMLVKSLRATKSLRSMNFELKEYNNNLESRVRKRMALLEESNLKFRDLYDNILDLVVLIDKEGLIRMVNQHGATLLGRTPEELQGRRLSDYLTPRDRDALFSEVIPRLGSGDEVKGIQLQMHTYHGRDFEVELSGSLVEMPDANPHFQLIIRDITVTKEMEKQVLESSQLIDSSRQVAIFGLARLAECRDDGTGSHLLRIREYTRILALELAQNPDLQDLVTEAYIEDLCLSSVLHDIGKVGIPDAILLKPEKLSEEEYNLMKRHCEYGSSALSSAEKDSESLSFLRMGQEITRFHHERWDGTGYPHGLAGAAIPLSARIVTLADVYDALTSSRSYKAAYNHQQARQVIVEESGRRFDPTVVNAFLRREQEFKAARRDLLMQSKYSEF